MRNISRVIVICIIVVCAFFLSGDVLAVEYMMPYPSFLPGNKLYRISRLLDTIERWWYWGDITSFKYHLKLADKYLIEAKTLFEYKQYLLAIDALKRSNLHVTLISQSLTSAHKNGKNTTGLELLQKNAMKEHIKILEKLIKDLPENYIWAPEKQTPREVHIFQLLTVSIEQRKQ